MSHDTDEKAQASVGDKEALYDQEIAPLLRQVNELCRAHGIPFVSCTQFSDTGFGTMAALPEYSDSRLLAAMQLFQHGFLAFMVQMMSPVDPVAGGSGGVIN